MDPNPEGDIHAYSFYVDICGFRGRLVYHSLRATAAAKSADAAETADGNADAIGYS